jgi:hypothetical protein
MKIKSDHPFTKAQLISLNSELEKISPAQIFGMNTTSIPSLNDDFMGIEIKHTFYDLNVYLSFMNVVDPDYPKSQLYQINSKGEIDKNIRANLEFESFSDRISYFANLEPIKFEY